MLLPLFSYGISQASRGDKEVSFLPEVTRGGENVGAEKRRLGGLWGETWGMHNEVSRSSASDPGCPLLWVMGHMEQTLGASRDLQRACEKSQTPAS